MNDDEMNEIYGGVHPAMEGGNHETCAACYANTCLQKLSQAMKKAQERMVDSLVKDIIPQPVYEFRITEQPWWLKFLERFGIWKLDEVRYEEGTIVGLRMLIHSGFDRDTTYSGIKRQDAAMWRKQCR